MAPGCVARDTTPPIRTLPVNFGLKGSETSYWRRSPVPQHARVVTEVDGHKVTDAGQLQVAVGQKQPGSSLNLSILRDLRVPAWAPSATAVWPLPAVTLGAQVVASMVMNPHPSADWAADVEPRNRARREEAKRLLAQLGPTPALDRVEQALRELAPFLE